MTSIPPRSLWAGRTLALLGIVFAALNLRSAVASFSPILDRVSAEIPLNSLIVGLLGSLPPVCFFLFGIITPAVVRRFRLEPVMVGALFIVALGLVVRASASETGMILLGTVLACAGMGAGNVLLPPLIKKYFPDRVGLLTTVYVTAISVSTFVPPLVAVPMAVSAGWRVSLGSWAAVAVLAMIPWMLLIRGGRRRGPDSEAIEEPEARLERSLWRSPMAWSVTAVFAVSSMNAYAMFAWLPQIMRDTAGQDAAEAATMLALFAFMGLPAGLVIPLLTVRMRSVAPLIWLGGACFVLGYAGLILAPAAAPYLWIAMLGIGPLLFPLALTLINRRTRTHAGAIALSGFVQGPGYILGALGPLITGLLHDLTGSWTVPLAVLALSGVVVVLVGRVAARPLYVEDEI